MPAINDSAYLVTAGWNHVPHLDEEMKRQMLERIPPYLRAARSQGVPSLGAGAIYPIDEAEILVPTMAVPPHWRRAYALDVGWNRTAGLWGAIDPDTTIAYLYAEYYQAEQVASVHAAAIRARGDWIPGVIDPAARGRSQKDGETLLAAYINNGLKVTPSNNAVVAGLDLVWELLATGRLKVMAHLHNFLAEYRLYRRDEKGNIVKKHDHLMDCMRYFCLSGRDVAITKPVIMMPGMGALGGTSNAAGY